MNAFIVLLLSMINEYHKVHTFKDRNIKLHLRFYEVVNNDIHHLSMPRTLVMHIAQYMIIYIKNDMTQAHNRKCTIFDILTNNV